MSDSITTDELIKRIENREHIFDVQVSDQFHFTEKMKNFLIFISGSTFKEGVKIKNFKSNSVIIFIGCTFDKYFDLSESCDLSDLQILNCIFNAVFFINDSTIEELLLVSTFCKYGLSSENLRCNSLSIELITSNSAKFSFRNPHVRRCTISKCKDSSELEFGSVDGNLVNSYFEAFDFNADGQFSGSLMIYSCHLKLLLVNGFNKSGRIMLQNVVIRSLSCSLFTNMGSIIISRMMADTISNISVQQSNLGKCELYDIDFSQFQSVTLGNSNIQDIVPTDIIWCKKIDCNATDNAKFTHLRETYRQLKNVMVRHNDKIQELTYHELEMDAYLYQIKKEKGKWADRFIVWTNKVSNNHGLSWTRPFIILMLTGLVIFNLNKWLLGYNHFNSTLLLKDCANYIESLNPVRRFDVVYTIYKEGWLANLALCLDVLFRILSSYLIFQFISAFRKYIKK